MEKRNFEKELQLLVNYYAKPGEEKQLEAAIRKLVKENKN